MAMATSTIVALAAAAASAGLQYHNTTQTANRQDREAAQGIRTQSEIQQRTDSKVNEEVDRLEQSTAAESKAKRFNDLTKTLQAARSNTNAGLSGDEGGDAFKAAAAGAQADLEAKGNESANLLSGIDAAGLQRQGEAFNFGNLATDIGLLSRESRGADFLTNLRMRGITRSPWMDAGSAILGGVSSAAAGAGGAGGADFAQGDPFKGSTPPTKLGPSKDQLIAAMRGYGG